ncbi:MAG: ComF family protein [Oleibacter sp.]|nr:ComF family protein [Thalassolituus sp.]
MCELCYADLPFSGLACPQCSEPIIHEGRCGRCQKAPPNYDYSYCALAYQAPMNIWLRQCKDRGKTHHIRFFAQLMLQSAPPWVITPDVIVSIPALQRRLFTRGFNLSDELAKIISNHYQRPHLRRALSKESKRDQRQLNAQQRKYGDVGLVLGPQSLEGKHVLIIDDVMTTGATLDQAARLLKNSGALTVGGWCLARTLKANTRFI